MITINNPTVLLGVVLLGFGIAVGVERIDNKRHLQVAVTALIWEKEWRWSY
ncbi:MAG: hypothetical protein O7D34_02195 [Ignavibacteria bacterium]|nr:hypothetical protein [Ignavibacteria bacterium]